MWQYPYNYKSTLFHEWPWTKFHSTAAVGIFYSATRFLVYSFSHDRYFNKKTASCIVFKANLSTRTLYCFSLTRATRTHVDSFRHVCEREKDLYKAFQSAAFCRAIITFFFLDNNPIEITERKKIEWLCVDCQVFFDNQIYSCDYEISSFFFYSIAIDQNYYYPAYFCRLTLVYERHLNNSSKQPSDGKRFF